MIAVETRNVVKVIRGCRILNDISFTIHEHEHVGIIGQNGSGKSMLFKVLSGLLIPTSGSVSIWEQSIGKKSFPTDFGCLIERPGMLMQYSGIENLRLLASIQEKTSVAEISDLMTQLGLDPTDKRPVRKYSMDMRQKLGIIQAVMEKPKLVILDEPMNNLDVESVQAVRNLIHKLQAEYGTTTIISSHNVEDIVELCDCVYRMTDGSMRKV